jgi:cell division protein FtsB
MQPKGAALRKRTQIVMANRMMFLWVAGVSVVFGFALVGAIFLTQMLLFNERVLQEKDRTVATLKTDNNNIQALEAQIRVLDTNQALINSKATSDDQAVQVILDALPSDANSLALGASIQNKLLAGIPGLKLNSLQVDPVIGIESLTGDSSIQNASLPTSSSALANEITFRFSVIGDDTALKQVLLNLESSIRTIDVISLKIEGQGSASMLSAQARAFYQPERVVQLKDKTVK